MRAVDLFAGPGGFDLGARAAGLDPLGVEWDDAACRTREAAGLRTLQADVAELDPLDHPCDVLIASPPCQAFSAAGKGGGHRDASLIYRVMRDLAHSTFRSDRRVEMRDALVDPRSMLVVEPLRWAIALRPRLVALEQVPPVLPFWEWIAEALRDRGYRTWTGVLSAEQFGVPQTRSRAFLLASRDGPVSSPSPTHRRYVAMPRERDHDRLFDPGDRERIVHPGDENLLPWVSMAEALGWSADDLVGFPRRSDSDRGWDADVAPRVEIDGVEYRERDLREADAPAFNLTGKANSWRREPGDGPARTLCGHWPPRWTYRNGNQERATERDLDEPASTILFGHRLNESVFVQRERSGDRSEEGFDPAGSPSQAVTSKARSWTVRTGDNSAQADGESIPYERPVDDPAPTLTAKVRSSWTVDRPSTVVAGDPRVHPPGHKENRKDPPGRFEQRRGENAIRISVEEASILQGFPADYPWQGSRTKRFEQIGNAVPPPLARAVLRTLLGAT